MAYKKHARTCSECGKGMNEGYCIGAGWHYYCSDVCLHKHYTPEEWEAMCADDDDSYYTEWEEDDEDDEDEDDESDLYPYIVLYRAFGIDPPNTQPFVFKCEADNALHAIEQCEDGNPGAIVLWSHQSDDVQAALDDYHANGKKEGEA